MDLAQICCEALGCGIVDVGKQEFFLHSGVNLEGHWSLVDVCRRGGTETVQITPLKTTIVFCP